MRPNPRSMLVAALVLAASACGGPPHVAREKSATSVASADATVMVVLDDEVKWQLELIDHREQVLPDGRLRAQVRFVNRSQKDAHVQVAWSFKDDRNFPVESDSPFEHVMVASGQTVALTRESLAAGATAFHIQVKTAKSAQD